VTGGVITLLLAVCAATAARAVQLTGASDAGGAKTFDVVASRYQFDPAAISVAKGDHVRLRLRSTDRSHTFAMKAFKVKTLIPKGGDPVTVEFVADRTGTFDFTCADYCGSGHGGMKGRLVVAAAEK
jgi:cytochrome c oxidase subunit 2